MREQVLLDVGSIQPDRVLLLDSYFYVVVFHGTTIAAWRKAEYHLLPEQVALKQLLEARGGPARLAGGGHERSRPKPPRVPALSCC